MNKNVSPDFIPRSSFESDAMVITPIDEKLFE